MSTENEIVIEPAKDYRQMYASSLVADLEKYAEKHGLFLGKKEWVQHTDWESCYHTIHKQDKLYLDAILFTGIVSAINNLEYAVIYDSTTHCGHFVFGMVKPDFRETYSNDKKWGISFYQAGKDNYDPMFGNEFRCFIKERDQIADKYQDFNDLVDYRDKWSQHISEAALDEVMEAFRHIEEKHKRRQKNNDSLERKRERIAENESRLTPMNEVLAERLDPANKITVLNKSITPSGKWPICIRMRIEANVRNLWVNCSLYYKPKRDAFFAFLHVSYVQLGKEEINFSVEGSVPRIIEAINYSLAFCNLYDKTMTQLESMHELYDMKDVDTTKED